MNCDGVRDLLSAYIDGELSAGELLRVEQHLRRCHCCADDVDSLRQTIALVASMEEVEVPATFHAQLHDRLVALGPTVAARRSVPAVASRRNQRRWVMPAAAAAAVAALAIGVSAYTQNGSGLPEGLLGKSVLVDQPIKVTDNSQTPTGKDPAPVGTTNVTQQPSADPPASGNGKVAGVDATPAEPGSTGRDGGAGVATPNQGGTTAQPVALKPQMAVIHQVTVPRDEALLAELRKGFLVWNEAADQISLPIPVGDIADALAKVRAIYPSVQPVDLSQDRAAAIDLLERTIAQKDAELLAVQSMAKEEQEARAQQILVWRTERDDAADELSTVRAQLKTALIIVKFQNP